ncbi:hypothetical protein K443DRAFT_671467 [Laccaria amethystina LaAM-08-1]|uniref:Uncharacterized protein n=1 Tax=Laccaria amethystina LaAM-08-1 TaxID=1095629 RepID=A0A0C9YGT0_9AGAR|nr:hypothetical protein K443DRAFT_671467 [Laccaria amethystina LaAM-08-1]
MRNVGLLSRFLLAAQDYPPRNSKGPFLRLAIALRPFIRNLRNPTEKVNDILTWKTNYRCDSCQSCVKGVGVRLWACTCPTSPCLGLFTSCETYKLLLWISVVAVIRKTRVGWPE